MNGFLVLKSPHKNFEGIKKIDESGIEYWEARELMPLLGYFKWSNFDSVVIEKAKVACENSGQAVSNHFADVGKMVILGSGSKREVKDYRLSRYACYLVAQNGDSSKQEIALAQTYFAVQTRRQEILNLILSLRELSSKRTKNSPRGNIIFHHFQNFWRI